MIGGSKVLAFVLSAILVVGIVPMSLPQQKAFAISVVPETDATNLVNALLAGGGSGIDTSTVTATLSGHSADGPSSTGIFTNLSGTYGINNGIVFSTGDVGDYADGPNIADDTATLYDVDATAEQHALLQPITGQDFHSDVTTLTLNFDMLPGSDTVFFNVAFGSEEWPEFVGFGFNDGFGIYVNDVNIASVGGNPVNIDNPLMAAVGGTELDGVLEDESLPIPTVHTFSAPVNPTGNTIIFILGDTGDSDYDTTVFFSQLGGTAPANLTISPTEWDYGAVETGSSAFKQFIVTNDGVVATTPLLLQLTGTNADQFSIANDACTGNTLDPEATCTFDGVFEPTVLTSKSATVTVSATVGGEASANLIGSAVEPANIAPTADAGTDQTVNEGDIVTLDGSASSDSDGTIATYAWTQTIGPSVILSDPSAAMPTFTAPIVDADTSLTFELVVTDDDAAASTPDSVNVLVTNVPTEASLEISPVSRNYGDVQVGSTSSFTLFTVQNVGESAATNVTVEFFNSDSTHFTMQNNFCTDISLAEGETCTVEAAFAPSSEGIKTTSLQVSSTAGGTPSAELTGNGTPLPPPPNEAPTANAGDDQAVDEGTLVTLDGSASSDSDGTIASYAWTQTAGTPVTLTGADTDSPTFTAPGVDSDTTLTFQLIVTDDDAADSDADFVVVTVNNVPTTANLTIIPNSHDYGDVQVGETSEFVLFTVQNVGEETATNVSLTFSGFGSGEFILQNNFCTNVSLSEGQTCTAEVAFLTTAEGVSQANLDVLSSAGGTPSAVLTGNGIISSPPNEPPVANAGTDQSVSEGTLVTLDGTGSSDSDGTIVAYAWTQTAGPEVILSDPSASQPTFTAPEVNADTPLTFELIVTDDDTAASNPDTVGILVTNVPTEANLTITPITHDYGDVQVGSTSSFTLFTVQNVGESAATNVTVEFFNSDSTHFTMQNNFCTDISLAEGETCTVEAAFAPDLEGVKTTTLQVSSTTGGTPFAELTGNGTPALPPAPETLQLETNVRDFKGTNEDGGHPDFEDGIASVSGIVQGTLGDDGKPVYCCPEPPFPSTTHGPEAFSQWYNNVDGVNMSTNKVITLTKVSDNPLLYEYDNSAYFPIDNELFGNTPGFSHNYHFTTEIHTQFTYETGQTFTFSGDDDVWVFINGQLAIDLGGVHGELTDSVDLDDDAASLGIVPGNVYTLDIFHAERHTTGSNFRITTSIVLETPPDPASLSITPTVHDFGDVQEGLTSSLGTFTITNEGETTSSPITMALGNTNADQFNIQNDNCTGLELAGDDSCTVDAQFAPTATGLKTTTLEASATEGGAASASLTGNGTEAPVVTVGRIVVNHDEWTLSDTGFSNAPDAAIFAENIGEFFTPNNGPGNFLVYSSNFGLTGNSLRTTMETAGHTWNVDTTEDFTMPNLTQYDAIFLGGSPVPDNQVLIDYVDAGGNVYLMGGTGIGGSAGEAAAWNTFLNHFGLSFESATYNAITGVLPSSGTHPVLGGVDELYYGNGQTISDFDLGNNVSIILFSGDLGIIAATDDSTSPPPNQSPTANAGDDQTVDEGTLVTLDGSASSDSDGTIATYAWTQTAGPTVALSDPSAAMPTFTAPEVDTDTVFTFELVVTDDDAADSTADSVNVTVQNIVPPPPENVPPIADAGDDQTVDEVTEVTLDGSASTDPDSGPSPLTYSWVQTAGPSVTLSDATAAMPTFTAPEVGTGGEVLTFELTVSDGAATDVDTVTVQVNDVSPPPSSPADAIRALIVKADGMGANPSMLKQAPELLEDENSNNDAAACGKLGAFINHVEAQSGKKFSHEQAEELIADARAIEEQLGC